MPDLPKALDCARDISNGSGERNGKYYDKRRTPCALPEENCGGQVLPVLNFISGSSANCRYFAESEEGQEVEQYSAKDDRPKPPYIQTRGKQVPESATQGKGSNVECH
jgi:hypothetical protein